jgi:hypothetical protein
MQLRAAALRLSTSLRPRASTEALREREGSRGAELGCSAALGAEEREEEEEEEEEEAGSAEEAADAGADAEGAKRARAALALRVPVDTWRCALLRAVSCICWAPCVWPWLCPCPWL